MNTVLGQTDRDNLCFSRRISCPLQAGNIDLLAERKARPTLLFIIEGKLGGGDPTHLVPFGGCDGDRYRSGFVSFDAESWGTKSMSIEV